VLEAVFILLEFPSPSRRFFIGSHSLPPLWFAVSVLQIYAASKKLAPIELEIPEKSDKANKPQPSEEVQLKAIDLGTGDSSKTTMIRAGLDPK
jgi:hypothetical protein